METPSVVVYPPPRRKAFAPLSAILPANLIPILGVPLIDRNLQALKVADVGEVHLLLDDRPRKTRSYLAGRASRYPRLHFHSLMEPVSPLHEAWSIRGRLGDAILFIPHTVLHSIDPAILLGIHRRSGNDVTLFESPMLRSSAVVYIVEKALLDRFMPGKEDNPGLIAEYAAASGCRLGVELLPFACDYIDSVAQWRDYQLHLITRDEAVLEESADLDAAMRGSVSGPVLVGDNVKIGRNVRIVGPVILGDNVVIGSGTLIKNSIILNRTEVGSGLDLVDCVVAGSLIYDPSADAALWINDRRVLSPSCGARGYLPLGTRWRSGVERLIALVILVLCSPAIALLAGAIKVTAHGSPFRRVRLIRSDEIEHRLARLHRFKPRQEVLFRVFRTDPPVPAWLGRVLRRTGLEDLPLLMNVIAGDIRIPDSLISWRRDGELTDSDQLPKDASLTAEERALQEALHALTIPRLGADSDDCFFRPST